MKKTIAIVTIAAIALIGTATTASAFQVGINTSASAFQVGIETSSHGMEVSQANQTPNIALSNTAEGGLNETSGIVVRTDSNFTGAILVDADTRSSSSPAA